MLFSKIATTSLKTAARARGFHASAAANAKVVVLGAAGGIGQPLSLLLKLSPEVDELACYDIVGTPGVAADLSHVSNELKLWRRFFALLTRRTTDRPMYSPILIIYTNHFSIL